MATLEIHDDRGKVQRVAVSRDHPALFGSSPECDIVLNAPGILPVYPLTEDLRPEHLRPLLRRALDQYAAALPDILPATEKGAFGSAAARLEKEGVPHELAARCAAFEPMFYALDIVDVAHSVQRDIEPVARLHFALAGELDFPWIRARIGALPAETHWHTLAKAALRDDLASMLRALAAEALRADGAADPASQIAAWKARNAVLYERVRQVLGELRAAETPDLAMLSVAMRELRNLSSR